ncbi:MAG: response regulator [Bdellovibrionales bacterium]|nr:response regulator [Bdellovibrionales bacterium]
MSIITDTTKKEAIDILLVDDRMENLVALESVLESETYHLIKVTSGDQALRYLLDHEPACILMDIQMPELDGYATTKLIRSNERTREIPIIFVTAISQDKRNVHQGYQHGAVDYIYKPYDPYILKAKVAVFAELARKNRRVLEVEKQLRIAEKREREQQITLLEIKGLRRSQLEQKRYLDLVEGINHGIVWSADLESLAISFVSPSAESILGFPVEHWFTENSFFIDRTHPDDRKKVLDAFRWLKTRGKDIDLDHRFISANGKEVWVHTGLRLGQNETGLEVRGLSVDIGKIKEAEEVLIENKKHSDFLSEASVLLSKSLDLDKVVPQIAHHVVPKISDWFCLCLAKTKPFLFAHSDPDKVRVMQEYISEAKPDGVSKPMHIPLLTPEHIEALVQDERHRANLQKLNLKSAMLIPLISHDHVYGMMMFMNSESGHRFTTSDFATVLDLTRRFTMAFDNANFYQQAQDAIKVRDEFLSVASHELKTPLTPLKLQIQILLRSIGMNKPTDLRPEKVRKMLEGSDRQIKRIDHLVDELLDIARINNSGRLQMKAEDFDLVELIAEVLDRFSGQFESSKCTVTTDLPEHLPVHWDRFRTEQVFINLLTNAIKYGHGKPIHVSSNSLGADVMFSIRDHGIGIAKEDQERIFKRFERAVSGKHFSGLGLGLYIVTQIVDAHHGGIQVFSEPDSGATFTVTQPRQFLDKVEVRVQQSELPPL